MPAYSFQEQFCEPVETGTKTHTVRRYRKGRQGHAKPGDTVYLYYAQRTRYCRKLGEGICTKTERIAIESDGITIWAEGDIVGRFLSNQETNAFAWRDGFREPGTCQEEPGNAWERMKAFFENGEGMDATTPFVGVIIHWTLKPRPSWRPKKIKNANRLQSIPA